MKAGRFLWGVTLIVLGLLLLGTITGYVDSTIWAKLVLLWPIYLVLLGLNFIIKNRYTYAIVGLAIIAVGIVLVVYLNPQGDYFTQDRGVSRDLTINATEAPKALNLSVETGAVNLNINTMTQDEAIKNLLMVSSYQTGEILAAQSDSAGVYDIKVTESGPASEGIYPLNRTINIYVNPEVLTNLTLNVGASKITIDLSAAKLASIVIKSGAITADIKVGSLVDSQNITIESGASSFVVRVPKGTALSVKSNSGLSTLSLPDGFSTVKFEDTYVSDNYDKSLKKLDLELKSGLTSLKVVNY